MPAPSLEYFVEIAKNLNITMAARKLHVSQQSLSAYIQKLEAYYGVPLLERKPVLRLTQAGELVYTAAQSIDQIQDALVEDIAGLTALPQEQQSISIGIFRPNANMLLRFFPLLEFSKKYPMISYTITEEANSKLRDLLWEGELDLIISSYIPSSAFPGFEEVPLYTDSEYILISDDLLRQYFPDDYPGCIQRFSKGVVLAEFHHIPVLMYPSASASRQLIERYFRDNRLPYSIVGESPDRFLTNNIVQNGTAYGFCTRWFWATLQKNGAERMLETVHSFPIVEPDMKRTVGLLYKKRDHYPAYFTDLIEMTRSGAYFENMSDG